MTVRIRILYTIPNFIIAGSGRVLANIALGLDREKFQPTVCVSRKGGSIEAELGASGIPVIEAPFTVSAKPYPGLLRRTCQAARVFKPYKFDLWHSWHYADDYTEPLIARLAGTKHWVYTKKAMGWGSRAWLLRSLLSTRIVADNTEMEEKFFNKWGLRKKVRLIPHGVNHRIFKPLPSNKKYYLNKFNLSEEAVLIGCVAHLVPVKGHPTLIEAVNNFSNVHLLLAGKQNDREYFSQLQAQVKILDLIEKVHFLDFIENIPEFLSAIDIAVLPTWDRWRREGCPVALLEAMACGKACIATDVPGSRDIIEDGISGLLVPPEDPHALANAIQRLIDDPELRQQLGLAARQRVETHYTIEKEVAAHEQLYREILKGMSR